MTKRRRFPPPEFRGQVALEVISGAKSAAGAGRVYCL